MLFEKLWPTLLKASVVEAISELKKDKKFEPAKVDDVAALLNDAAKGKAKEKEVTKRIRVIERETPKSYLFQTREAKPGAPALRNNYIVK